MTRIRIALSALLVTAALPAFAAEPGTLDQRVDRVEKQLKAVQRKVFPGGDAAFQAPEISRPDTQITVGTPASTPLNDLTARIDALEKSVTQLTGQVEQDEHRLDVLSQQSAQDRQEFATRLKALEAAAAPAQPTDASVTGDTPPATTDGLPPKGTKPFSTVTPVKTAPGAPAKPAVKPAPAKPAAVADTTATADGASAGPATGDPAEDAYMAGYKLWTQKKYPEAEAALAAVVKKYPKHKRASYAQNLLGRAYLEDGQPALAAEAFVKNYQLNPHGDRAPDSLYYAGQALAKLKRPADACRVYDEVASVYGDNLDATLKTRIKAARADAKCK